MNNLIKELTKRLASLALAAAMVLPVAACANNPSSTVNPDQGITTPVNPDNPNNPENPTSKYSTLLNELLTNSYYRDIIADLEENHNIIDSQLYDPIPYGFLEKEGYNINDIKNDVLEVDSVAYTKENEPNNLYVVIRVETKGETPYYTCYTLRYSLSDEELNDLNMLHNNIYFEAPLFIQKISYNKTPTVVSEAKITVSALNGLIEVFKKHEYLFGHNNITVDLLDFSVDQIINLSVRPEYVKPFVAKAKIHYAELIPSAPPIDPFITINGGSVLAGPKSYVTFTSDDKFNEFKSTYDAVTYYDTQIKLSFNYDLELNNLINNNNL